MVLLACAQVTHTPPSLPPVVKYRDTYTHTTRCTRAKTHHVRCRCRMRGQRSTKHPPHIGTILLPAHPNPPQQPTSEKTLKYCRHASLPQLMALVSYHLLVSTGARSLVPGGERRRWRSRPMTRCSTMCWCLLEHAAWCPVARAAAREACIIRDREACIIRDNTRESTLLCCFNVSVCVCQ